MKKYFLLASVTFVLPFSIIAFAQNWDSDVQTSELKYFSPPRAGSFESAEDRVELLVDQKYATPARCAEIQSEVNPTLKAVFGRYILKNKLMTEAALDTVDEFFNYEIWGPVDDTAHVIKDKFQRPRPYVALPFLAAAKAKCAAPNDASAYSSSYVSGHAALAGAESRLLIDILPCREKEFRRLGLRAGINRIIAAVHYPSDVYDGARLGHEVYAILKQNPQFDSEVSALRANFGKFCATSVDKVKDLRVHGFSVQPGTNKQ